MARLHRILTTGCLCLAVAVSSFAASNSRVARDDRPATVRVNPTSGTAEVVSGRFAVPGGSSLLDKAVSFIDSHEQEFKLSDARSELQLLAERTDDLGLHHLRFQQVYDGLEVWGCRTIVHFEDEQTIYMVGGQTVPTPELSTSPSVSAAAAEDGALAALKTENLPGNATADAELLIYPDGAVSHLAWMVTVSSPTTGAVNWKVFVDAHSNQILHKFNDVAFDGPDVGSGPDTRDSLRTLNIYESSGQYQLRDVVTGPEIRTHIDYWNGGSVSVDPDADKVWDDNTGQKAEVAGHYYAQKTIDYYLSVIGRNSYNGSGGTLVVNIHDPSITNNAYYSGGVISFGDGDGFNYLPFSGSQDVVAHEFTHGVTAFSAGLIYQYASGAINESYSDVFGFMLDQDDWLLGEEIGLGGNYIRSMSDPTLKGDPKHMDNYLYLPIDVDNGGVHSNSGIGNHLFYRAANYMGDNQKAADVWYRALTVYLTPSSGYYFFGAMLTQSAIDLYGSGSSEVDDMILALQTVGLSTSYVQPQQIALSVKAGTAASTSVWLHNPGPDPISILGTPSTSLSDVTVSTGPGYLGTMSMSDSSEFVIELDATSSDECDIGARQDTLDFEVDNGAVTFTIRVPIIATIGFTTASEEQTNIQTACLDARVTNTTLMDQFGVGVDDLFQGSLLVGLVDGNDTTVYRDFFGTQSLTAVDTIAGTVSDDSVSFRLASYDGRIQGRANFWSPPIGGSSDSCAFVIAEYTLVNPCDTPLTILPGVIWDVDIGASGSNKTDYDVPLNMVYETDNSDTRAVGLALLSGTPRNLFGVSNPVFLWNDASDGTLYVLLSQTSNNDGPAPTDWSILLSAGEATIGPGDTNRFTIAMMHSTTGSSGLPDLVDQALDFIDPGCCVNRVGDVNLSGTFPAEVDSQDLGLMVSFLFSPPGTVTLPCVEEADTDLGGGANPVDSTDLGLLVNFLFAPPGTIILNACP